MSIFSYAVRNAGGAVVRGQTTGTDGNVIYTNSSVDVSLNLAPSQIAAYTQSGNNLVIELINGEIITLDGYFSGPDASDRELFLSKEGQFHKVDLGDEVDGRFIANYELADVSGKWSQYDELTFLDLERVEPVVAPLAAPAFGWLGLAGAGVAATSVVAGGGGGGTGGDGSSEIIPTVDDADVERVIGGTGPSDVTITGTGEAGSTVTITIGDQTATTTVGDDGTWTSSFGADDLPADGDYTSTVTVVNPGGTTYNLAGPVVDIDTTPPDVTVSEGTLSVGEVVNGEEQADGHIIAGIGEPGATVDVEIDGTVETTTVGDDGSWSVNFAADAIATGDYQSEITITSTDARGNSTTVSDTLSVDTIAPDATLNTVAGDDVINANEAANAVTLNGTAEVGSTLVVQFQGQSHTVDVADDGSWSLDLAAGSVASGSYDSTITLVATDAAGNVNSMDYTIEVDTEGSVTLSSPIEGDNIANADEVSDGITLTGTAEAGSEVVVALQGVSHTVIADESGNWSADFAASEIASGEYDATIDVTATDPAGNVTTTTGSVHIDTQTDVAIDDGQAGGDDVANANEVTAGLSLTGQAEAGAQVQVTLEGVTKTVTAAANGTWSADFAFAEIPQGEYDAAVSVVATDAAGNTNTATSTLRVDTELAVAIDAGQAGGDDIANAEEVANSLTFTGTADAGSSVQVLFQGVAKTVTAAADGTWEATYASTEVPQGEYTGALTVTATDDAGNSETSSTDIRVDTSTSTTISVQQASGADGTVNAGELQDGLVLDGSAEAGATIVVDVDGVTRTTTANESGYWSVTYEDGSLPAGTYTATATVTATDIAGNTASSSHDFQVDTEITDPIVSSVTFSDDDVTSLTLENDDQTFNLHALNADNSTDAIGATEVALPSSESLFVLDTPAPDGTHLVVSAEDSAGNVSDTLLVLDDNMTNAGTLDHAGLDQFQIQGIELDYASDTSLTLTEAQIKELSDTSDSLTIHGGNDDQVTISGADKTAETREIDGEDYDVYTIGDDGVTVIIDQDINVVI